MAEDTGEKKQQKSMMESIMSVPGSKVIGLQGDKKKAQERIMESYEDRESTRNEKIMKDFADSVNEPAKSIGERIEGQ